MPGFFRDDEDEHRGEPDRGKPAITQNLGPLPVWGWGAVIVGAVFIYRMMSRASGGTAASSGPASPAYPAGGNVGGVFLIPQGTGGLTGGTGTTPTSQDSGSTGVPWVFALGRDANIYGRQLVDNNWGPWTWFGGGAAAGSSREPSPLNGPQGGFTSEPTLSGNWLFARGGDNALWGRQFVNGVWSGWQSFGADLKSGPGGGTVTPGTTPSTLADPNGPFTVAPYASA